MRVVVNAKGDGEGLEMRGRYKFKDARYTYRMNNNNIDKIESSLG
ncbi:MAG: hypothetical protein C5S49_07305 [Candidatus Methanogaster sp.]|nr:MAG: hypothetical protein C5S49_07305 [ANME-2 cluster archaeon]